MVDALNDNSISEGGRPRRNERQDYITYLSVSFNLIYVESCSLY